MPANTLPIFTLTPNCQISSIAAANTAGDGSGALVLAFTAGANGSLLSKITFTAAQLAVGAYAAKVFRIYVSDSSGANFTKRGEVAVIALTGSTTAIGQTTTFTFTDGLVIKSGQIVKVSQSIYASVADQTHVIAEGGDY